VHGEDFLVNDSGNRQAVEAVRKCLPQLDIVSPLALVVEPVDAVDRGAFMVATEDEEVLGVLDLVGQQEADGLEGLFATVDVVAEEEVVGLGREAAVLEQAQQIVVLAVDISANLVDMSMCHKRVQRVAARGERASIPLWGPQARAGWAVR